MYIISSTFAWWFSVWSCSVTVKLSASPSLHYDGMYMCMIHILLLNLHLLVLHQLLAISLLTPVFSSPIPLNLTPPLQPITANPPTIYYPVPLIPHLSIPCIPWSSCYLLPCTPQRPPSPLTPALVPLIVCVMCDPARGWNNVLQGVEVIMTQWWVMEADRQAGRQADGCILKLN